MRDHKKLFRSLSNIFGLYSEGQRWPQSWLNRVLGTPFPFLKMEGTWKSPRLGLNLYEAVLAGETEAITFFEDWEASVVEAVPPNRLLVFRVQEGWKPLAAFLGLPEVESDTYDISFQILSEFNSCSRPIHSRM